MSDNDAEALMDKTSQAGLGCAMALPLQLLLLQQQYVQQQAVAMRAWLKLNPFTAPLA